MHWEFPSSASITPQNMHDVRSTLHKSRYFRLPSITDYANHVDMDVEVEVEL